jgi:hypothetical protein
LHPPRLELALSQKSCDASYRSEKRKARLKTGKEAGSRDNKSHQEDRKARENTQHTKAQPGH